MCGTALFDRRVTTTSTAVTIKRPNQVERGKSALALRKITDGPSRSELPRPRGKNRPIRVRRAVTAVRIVADQADCFRGSTYIAAC